jgi:hypothetical protein
VSEFTEFDSDHFAKLARRRKVRERVRESIDRILDAQPFHERKWFRLSELINHCAEIPGMLLSDSSRKEEVFEIFRVSIYRGDFGGDVGQSTRIRWIEPSAPRWLPRDSAAPNGLLFPSIGDLLISRADAAAWFRRQGVTPPHGLAEPESPNDWVAAPASAQAKADSVKSRRQIGFQTSRLRKALDKIYPEGLPPLEILPNNAIVKEVKLFFIKEKWVPLPARRTIIRLLDKLRPENPDR